MKVALTGATGFIGSHVLAELAGRGHEVTALVRDDAQAEAVAARGVAPAVVDLYDTTSVVSLLSDAEGAIHTASPGDETSAKLDSAVVDAAIEAFDGTGKPYLHISGAWVYGNNTHITEDSPFNSPALVAWREPIEKRLLDATGLRGVVIVSGVAYGDGGGGVPGLVLGSPRDDHGNLIMLGTGNSTGRRSTLPTWRTSSGACWRTTRLVATTSSATDAIRPSPSSPTRLLWPSALREPSPAPTTRLGHGWATISPRCSCSIRAPTRPRLAPSSAGGRRIRDSSTSSAPGATASKRRTPRR